MRIQSVAAAAAVALAVALAGCANTDSGDGQTSGSEPGAAASATQPPSRLIVTFDEDGTGAAVKSWTLECDPAGGNHPDAAGACAALAAAKAPFARPARGVVCTQIYGGPSVATIKGTWGGAPVAARYSRANGCDISRWDAVSKVIPAGPAGPSPGRGG